MTGTFCPRARSSLSSPQPSIGSGSIRSMIATSGWSDCAFSRAWSASSAMETL